MRNLSLIYIFVLLCSQFLHSTNQPFITISYQVEISQDTLVRPIRRVPRDSIRARAAMRAGMMVAPTSTQESKISIRGQVLNKANKPLSKVRVTEKGTNNRTETDEDGEFILYIDPQATLIFLSRSRRLREEVKSENGVTNYSGNFMNVTWHQLVPYSLKLPPDEEDPKDTTEDLDDETMDFPKLEFPPPMPTTNHIMDKSLFSSCNTFGDVDAILIGALMNNGYDGNSYFSAPNGFAILTKLEKINSDGTSSMEADRFNEDARTFIMSVSKYLKSLFFGSEGHYRLILFIVTDNTVKPEGSLSKDEAEKWYKKGNLKLPNSISQKNFTEHHDIYALIYEFTKTETSEGVLNLPGSRLGLNGYDHLINSKILTWMEGRR